ncbi:MAG: LOG family protein [Opitutia bacterium]|jgi:uncharacterized protein (TIGR00730 family)
MSTPDPAPKRVTPLKAFDNPEFMHSTFARSIRVQCEMQEPYMRFKRHGVRNTFVMFGSARTLPRDVAEGRLAELRAAGADAAALLKAEHALRSSKYYEACRRLSAELTRWSLTLPEWQRFYICSGGGPGIMEAANRGATEAGGKSVGLGIALPFEQSHNVYIPQELDLEFHYFFIRKFWFLYLAKAMVVFPGGFGTFDELFEMLTLVQTKKTRKKIPILLFGSDFWKSLLNLDVMHEWGMISPEDDQLYRHVDSVEEARDFLIEEMKRLYLSPDGRPRE